jgi:hypothetical protein
VSYVQGDLFPTPVPPKLIGFWAPAPQSGKSTVADTVSRLVDDRDVVHIAFADPLRRIIETTLTQIGVEPRVVIDRVWRGVAKEEPIPGAYGKSFVDLAIEVGTKFGRGWLAETVWVDAYRRSVRSAHDPTNDLLPPEGHGPTLVLTDDVRFRNEADVVRELGGVLVGIRRPGATVSAARAAAEGHLTFDDMDHVIENDGCLTSLNMKTAGLMRRLGFSF